MPVLVAELTVDPAASHPPRREEGLGLGSGPPVHFARLGPDQPALAAAEMASLEARARVGRGQRRMRDEHTVRSTHSPSLLLGSALMMPALMATGGDACAMGTR